MIGSIIRISVAVFIVVNVAFKVTPGTMMTGMIFAAVMGVLGGFLPALGAARQPLATSLRKG